MAESSSANSPSENGGCAKLLFGIVAGMALSGAYIKFNWALPGWMQIPGLIQGVGAIAVADSVIEDPNADFKTKQRAVEELFRRDPKLLRELDNEMGHAITQAILDRKARRRLMLFQSKQTAMRQQLEKLDALREAAMKKHGADSMDALMLRTGIDDLHADAFFYDYLKQRFPGASDAALFEKTMALKPPDVFDIAPEAIP